jgi:hypothetical protein
MRTETEVTTTEAARALGVTPQAVTRAIREGRLKARIDRKPGAARGTWKIDRAALATWEPVTEQAERMRRAQAARWEGDDAEAKRLAAIDAIAGSLARYGGPTLEDFLREKREDLEREEYRSAAHG